MPLVKGFDIDSFLDEPGEMASLETKPIEKQSFDIDIFLDEPFEGKKPEPSFQAVELPWLEEYVINPLREGYYRGKQSTSLLLDEVGLSAGDPVEKAVRLADLQRQSERYSASIEDAEALSRAANAKTIGEFVDEVVENPQIVSNVALSSMGMFAPVLAATAAASTVSGPVGAGTAAGAGSTAIEYSSTIIQKLQEAGMDPKDPLAWSKALNDEDLMSEARESGLKRGIAIGMFDAITAGLAGKLLMSAKPGFVSPATRAVGELGLQAGGGMAGETTAQIADEGKITSLGEIALEGIAEIPSAFVEVPSNIRSAAIAAKTKEPKIIADEIQGTETVDEALAKADELVSESITPEIVPEPIIETPVTEPTRGYEAELTALAETRRQAEELIGVMPIEEAKDIAEVEKDRFRALQEARVAEEPEQPTAMELAIREAQRKREAQKPIDGVEARPVERPEIPVIEPTEAAPERIITPEVQEQVKPDEGKSVYENVAELFSAPDIAPAENIVNTIREDITAAESKGKTPFYTVRRDMGKGKYQYEAYGLDGKRIGRPSTRLPKSTAKTSQIRDTFISVPNNWIAPNYRQVSLEAPKKPVKSLGEIMINYEYDGPKKARANSPAVKTHVTELKNRINELQKVLNCVRN